MSEDAFGWYGSSTITDRSIVDHHRLLRLQLLQLRHLPHHLPLHQRHRRRLHHHHHRRRRCYQLRESWSRCGR